MNKELLFVVKELNKGAVVIDSEGYTCGVYETLAQAEKAIPSIKRNLEKGSVSPKLLKQERQQNRQPSRKK